MTVFDWIVGVFAAVGIVCTVIFLVNLVFKFSTIRPFKREKSVQNNVTPYVNGSLRVPRLMHMVHYSEDKPERVEDGEVK